MITSKTFLFTSFSNMSGEYTFRFTPFQGNIIFQHDLNLTVYSPNGKYTVALHDAGIQLPYSKQIFVFTDPTELTTGRRGFGTLHIQTKDIKSDSITIRYWIDVYRPDAWYDGLTYEGILKCFTENPTLSEIIETFVRLI